MTNVSNDGHTSQPAVGDADTSQDLLVVTWRCPLSLQENAYQLLWKKLDINMEHAFVNPILKNGDVGLSTAD